MSEDGADLYNVTHLVADLYKVTHLVCWWVIGGLYISTPCQMQFIIIIICVVNDFM